MEELIAKRYVKALTESCNIDELKEMENYFLALSKLYKDWKIKEIIVSPEIKNEEKLHLLMDGVKKPSKKLVNFMKLLAQKRRLGIIPAIAHELQMQIAKMEKTYTGRVYSEFELGSKELKELQKAIEKRVGAKVVLTQASTPFDGIKVEVEPIGLEIEFSKSKIRKQLIENILKAI